jgi:hypothetical protein
MQRDSIKKRLEVLEARQPPEEEEVKYIEVTDEAWQSYEKCYLACKEATETEEDFNKLFIRCAGSALALVSSRKIEREFDSEFDRPEEQKRKDQEYMDVIDLEVMEEMVKLLKEKGIVV